MEQSVKEKLEKQLELLSELSRTNKDKYLAEDLYKLSLAMVELAKVLGLYS
ncbi:MAG: hypothetical protein HDS66_08540 [Bacteroidales bacterium]|nr:hypothetical protein [Bacteroidales bacterium]